MFLTYNSDMQWTLTNSITVTVLGIEGMIAAYIMLQLLGNILRLFILDLLQLG